MRNKIILISLILTFKTVILEPLKIHFKQKPQNSDSNTFEKFKFYNIYTDISIGTPPQTIETKLTMEYSPFVIKSKEIEGKYNENESSTFKKTSEEFEFIRETLFTDGFLSKEKFYFKDYNNKDYTIEEFNFILATKFNSKTSKPFNACLGLTLLNKNQDMHFILFYELK